jgi:hypothetical protein
MKVFKTMGLFVALACAGTAFAQSYSSPEDVLAHFKEEPTIGQVQQWANEYAGTHPSSVDKWLKASKKFATLPELKLEYRFRDGWDRDFEYYPADGVIDTVDEAVYDVLDDAGRDQDQYFIVRATWDLDKLMMSSERIRVLNEAQDVVKLRDKVLSEVTRLYFERRRIQVDSLLASGSSLEKRLKKELQLRELTAGIDALSGGAFSRALAK